MLQKLQETLTSRKLWAAVAGVVLAEMGVDPAVSATIVAYILGQAWVDAAKAKALPG